MIPKATQMLTSDIKNYNERESHSASLLLSTFYSEQPSLSAKTRGSPNFDMHHLEGFLNTPFDSIGQLRRDLRICISGKFLGDADIARPGTTF